MKEDKEKEMDKIAFEIFGLSGYIPIAVQDLIMGFDGKVYDFLDRLTDKIAEKFEQYKKLEVL